MAAASVAATSAFEIAEPTGPGGARRAARPGRRRRALCLALLAVLLAPEGRAGPAGIQLKVDRVTLNDPSFASASTTSVSFRQSYASPPLVFLLPGNANGDPSTLRVANVTSSGFEVWTAESDGEDGVTAAEDVSYLAIEPGAYDLGGGFVLQAGSIATTRTQSGVGLGTGYDTVGFAPGFAAAPVVLHEVQSFANDPFYGFDGPALTQPFLETTSLQASATTSGISVALERAETNGGTVAANETIAWLAVTPGNATFLDGAAATVELSGLVTAQNIDDGCSANGHGLATGSSVVALASLGSRAGNNGGWLRSCSVSPTTLVLRVQEDRANDGETSHIDESAAVLAFSRAFDAPGAGSTPRWEAARATVNVQNASASLAFESVAFPNAFQTTPLVFVLPTNEGAAPASVRVRSVSANGFQVSQVVPQGEIAAPSMTVDYVAVVPGIHTLPDGSILEAGAIATSAFQGKNTAPQSYSSLGFASAFSAPPALLLEVQTTSSQPGLDPGLPTAPWLETAVESGSLTASGARVALERAETSNGTVVTEQVAYLAVEDGLSTTLRSLAGATIELKAMRTADNVRGAADGCFANAFPGGGFSAGPFAVANMASRDGGDGGWIRRCSLGTGQIGLHVDEDRAQDTDRSHTTEVASVVAFSGAFEWCASRLAVTKTTSVLRDPVNALANPKSIPGALQRYAIRVENVGGVPADDGSVRIVDPVPASTALFVESTTAHPEPPFVFTDGTGADASGLAFVYAGPGSTTDDVEFSDDGGASYGYLPTPDADGFDPAVTHVRLSPTGVFAGGAAATPAFTIEVGVRID